MAPKLFDSKCYDLAEQFLAETSFNTPAMAEELAIAIQETIEDFIEGLEQELAEEDADD